MKQTAMSIILPTYNERGNIVRLIHAIIKTINPSLKNYEIIVVDDMSTDGTADYVREKFARNKKVNVFIRNERGLASAIYFGIQKAKGSVIAVMDTDFNHDPKELLKMRQLIAKNDLIIGSRFIGNGGMQNKIRETLSRIFNLYIKSILGHSISDNLSGYFMIKKTLSNKLPSSSIYYGFGDYFIRLIYLSYKRNAKIAEVPIFYINRTYGVSKSRFIKMFYEYTVSALALRFTSS